MSKQTRVQVLDDHESQRRQILNEDIHVRLDGSDEEYSVSSRWGAAYKETTGDTGLELESGDYSSMLQEIADPTVHDHEVDSSRDIEDVKQIKRDIYIDAVMDAIERMYGESASSSAYADEVQEHEEPWMYASRQHNEDLMKIEEALENQEFDRADRLMVS